MITLHMKSSAVWRRQGPVRLNGTEDASYSRGQGDGVGKDGWTECYVRLCVPTARKRARKAGSCIRAEGVSRTELGNPEGVF